MTNDIVECCSEPCHRCNGLIDTYDVRDAYKGVYSIPYLMANINRNILTYCNILGWFVP